jgi:hypothetical protein
MSSSTEEQFEADFAEALKQLFPLSGGSTLSPDAETFFGLNVDLDEGTCGDCPCGGSCGTKSVPDSWGEYVPAAPSLVDTVVTRLRDIVEIEGDPAEALEAVSILLHLGEI